MATCLRCSKEFVKASGVQKYCTRECLKAASSESKRGPLRVVQCKGCEKKFETTNAQVEFCGSTCRHAYFNSQRPTSKNDVRSCVVCGTSFQPMQKTGPGRKWCSEACKHVMGGNSQRLRRHLTGVDVPPEIIEAARQSRSERSLKQTFGISLAQYESMFDAQKGLCAICKNPETAKNNYDKVTRRLAVDHCHTSGKIRALLCSACNTAIGLMNDDTARIQAAIEYLKSHQEE